jgi:hypothetical protein
MASLEPGRALLLFLFFDLLLSKEGLVFVNGVEELSWCTFRFVDLRFEDVQLLLCFGELDFLVQ